MNTIDEYQWIGANFLASKRFALLADEMGLGKTAQAIIAADTIRAERILVICPAVARINWKREFYEFSIYDRDFYVCTRLSDRPTPNTIVSYDFAVENHSGLIQMSWDLVIIDESHFIKEPEAQRTVKIYGKNGIIRKTKRLWCLSGTPAPNHAGELWPMLYTFGATSMGYSEWITKFCNVRTRWYGMRQVEQVYGTKDKSAPLLKHILSKVMLRRKVEDVMKDMPKLNIFDYTVEAAELPVTVEYDKQKYINEKRLAEEALGYVEDQSVLILEALAQSIPTLRRINGLRTAYSVADLVAQELKDNAYPKIILFAWHREVIEVLIEKLKDFKPVSIYGGTSAEVRQKAIDDFQNDPHTRVFIGQLIAAGTAITLTAANQVGIVEPDYVPGVNAQAIKRAHRRGQIKPVFVRFFTIEDSIATKITRIFRRKAQELSAIFDEGETNETNN